MHYEKFVIVFRRATGIKIIKISRTWHINSAPGILRVRDIDYSLPLPVESSIVQLNKEHNDIIL